MAADPLQLVIDFLRVGNFAGQYSNQLDQFLYAIFFPTILVVMVLYLLLPKVFEGHKGLQTLLGLSFFIFLIVYPPNAQTSLYGMFAPIGTFWYLVVILLGFLLVLKGKIIPHGGGAKALSIPGGTLQSLKEAAIGKTLIDPRERARSKKLWEDELKVIHAQIKELEDAMAGLSGGEKEKYAERLAILKERKRQVEESIKRGWPYAGAG